jgi:hypothetical protein
MGGALDAQLGAFSAGNVQPAQSGAVNVARAKLAKGTRSCVVAEVVDPSAVAVTV